MKPLVVSRRLLDAFHAEDVRYCHWKSSEHVLAGLAGRTDLDILVDRHQAGLTQDVLARCGFKRFEATIGMGYPAIEDYLALDEETGTLVHCHLHYRLVAGEQHLKGMRLPWEDRFLATRVWDPELCIFLVHPDLELVTLLLRASVKLRSGHRLADVIGRKYPGRGMRAEYEWLRARVDRDRVLALSEELLGQATRAPMAELLDDVTVPRLMRLRRAASAQLDRFRYYGRVQGVVLQGVRSVAWTVAGVNRRLLRSPRPLRRTIPSGGVVIAFLGSDGSGKSTLVRELGKTFAAKIDVYRIYFGSGDGPVSLVRLPLRVARQAYARVTKGSRQKRSGQSSVSIGRPSGPGAGLARFLWALSLAHEKSDRLASAWQARSLGMMVLADRYPQTQVSGFNDGPLLTGLGESSGGMARWAAARELTTYEWAARQPPDLVIRLNVSPAVAVARKPEMTVEEVTRRVAAVRSLTFPGARIVDLDADQPLEVVLRQAKWAVWEIL